MTMRLTKFSHSCVRLERDGAVMVIDPGVWSERQALDGADAVLITHEHFDHVDVPALAEALGKRQNIEVYTHPDVAKLLSEHAGNVREVVPGDSFTAVGFDVRVYGGLHAMIHPELPRVANNGYFVAGADGTGGLYHPGDSFDVPTDADVDALLVPISGPWLKIAEAIEFVRAVRPHWAYALHDGLLNDIGARLADTHLANLSGAEYARLNPGHAVTVA